MIQTGSMGTENGKAKLHVGIIMDGNGRWARGRGLPRVAGHREGAKSVRRIIEAAPDLGIGTLTLYAFSSDNWQRPRPEVDALMRLFLRYLRSETAECVQKEVRISVIGRRDRLPLILQREIETTEQATRNGRRLLVRLAVDYSAREVIFEAARRTAMEAALAVQNGEPPRLPTRHGFTQAMADVMYADAAADVDLLVRTGGEQRISDFMLWEAAYAELVFTQQKWPDFDGDQLALAVEEFHRRERRFGTVPEAPLVSSQLSWPSQAQNGPELSR
ncbi:MAG: polyprenyl diphosphate synthase [Terriglobales bacterium]